MPILQSEFNAAPPIGIVGRRQNMEEWNGFTGHPIAATIGAAYPVEDAGVGEQIDIFTDGNFRGITEADTFGLPDEFYPIGYNVPVLESGVIFGLAVAACTKRTPVYWVAATGGYQSSDTGGVLIPGAEFDATAVAGDPVAIRLRRAVPVPAAA